MPRPPRFHTKPLRKRRPARKSWWRRILPWLTLLLAAGAAAIIMRLPDSGGDWEAASTRFTLCADRSSNGCVIDGDTILFGQGKDQFDQSKDQRKIRITGYNAPEIAGECPAEKALAIRSRDALLVWLNQGPFQMSGGDEPPYDQYGRELRTLKRGEEWLAETMIESKLAQQSGWGFTRGGWCD